MASHAIRTIPDITRARHPVAARLQWQLACAPLPSVRASLSPQAPSVRMDVARRHCTLLTLVQEAQSISPSRGSHQRCWPVCRPAMQLQGICPCYLESCSSGICAHGVTEWQPYLRRQWGRTAMDANLSGTAANCRHPGQSVRSGPGACSQRCLNAGPQLWGDTGQGPPLHSQRLACTASAAGNDNVGVFP